jgi:hypothetical protein
MMKTPIRLLLAIALPFVLISPVFADTIRLKDGSVIHGQVIGFKDQTFTILIGGGAKGRRGQTTIYVEDIESIEFDNSGVSSNPADYSNTGSNSGNSGNNAPPVMSQPNRNTSQQDNDPPVTQPTSGSSPTFFTIKVSVRADNMNNGWTNSGLVVRKGQRLRISASGRVSLGRTRFSTPGGIATIQDRDKLMPNEATGALIAVIGDNNDDFILVGPRREFIAQRDGVLFLGVNEGDLTDNTGSYDIVIEAEAGGAGARP